MTFKVWGIGRVNDLWDEAASRGNRPSQADVFGYGDAKRIDQRSPRKKVKRPKMAAHITGTSGFSQRCFRYQRVLNCENAKINDRLLALTNALQNWALICVFVVTQLEGA
jgi:hypothetical protein